MAMVNMHFLNKSIITCLWLEITKTIHPLLSQYSSKKTWGGKIFWPIGGMFIQRGAYLRGGANLRIYGKQHFFTTAWKT